MRRKLYLAMAVLFAVLMSIGQPMAGYGMGAGEGAATSEACSACDTTAAPMDMASCHAMCAARVHTSAIGSRLAAYPATFHDVAGHVWRGLRLPPEPYPPRAALAA